jgi:hypothetical protein
MPGETQPPRPAIARIDRERGLGPAVFGIGKAVGAAVPEGVTAFDEEIPGVGHGLRPHIACMDQAQHGIRRHTAQQLRSKVGFH